MRYLFAFLCFPVLLSAQDDDILVVRIAHSCSYEGEERASDYYTFKPSTEADRIVQEICDAKGLAKNFVVRSANVSNAVATMDADGFVFVQGGTFTMGCTAEQGSDCDTDEKPTRQVTLSDYYIGKYEVTQKQWRNVMGSNPPELGFPGCDDCPVENVSWNDVQDFLKKLNSANPGKNYRLPTEAEWEYAARGGNLTKNYKYAGGNTLDEVAWYSFNSGSKTRSVGGKKANELGLYDMSGNVWEWCSDWKGTYPSEAEANPMGSGSGDYRVSRGGSWLLVALYCRVADRFSNTSSYRSNLLGLRLCRAR